MRRDERGQTSRALPLVLLAALAGGVAWASTPESRASGDGALVERIRTMEYEFSTTDDGAFAAPNRARNIRSRIDADGLRWEPRLAADGERWSARLRLVAIERDDTRTAIEPTAPRLADALRVERPLPGGREWYVNGPRGLEHGITLDRRLGTSDGPLALDFALDGDLAPRIDAGGRDAALLDRHDRVALRYDGLTAFDADGARLAARLERTPRGLRIVVDDTAAVYPIVIDPLSGAPDWSATSGQGAAQFGVSVAGVGDVNDDGYADVMVGAQEYDNGEVDEGRAFLFLGSPAGLSLVPDWFAEGDTVGVRFGGAVAAAGDLNLDGYGDVVIGARRYTSVATSEGAAFVFYGSASGLDAGGTRAVGTPANADWWARGEQVEANFGKSVGTAGDVNGDGYPDLLVGADEYTAGTTDEGAVFVFAGGPSGLDAGGARPIGTPANADWSVESGFTEADFGVSAASAGDVNADGFGDVIVGAHKLDNNNLDEGRAFLYLGSASGIGGSPAWFFDGVRDQAQVGISVAGAGDVNGDGFDDVIVGADRFTNGQVREGRAFVFHGNAAGQLPSTPNWRAEGEQLYAEFGLSVAGAGDVNGDGFSDIIVGAPSFDISALDSDEGRAYVYLGSPTGVLGLPAHTLEVAQFEGRFAFAVAGAGDVDGDGFDDVVVGSTLHDAALIDEGAAFAWHGCPDQDRDGVCDPDDNCLTTPNPDQFDVDGDGEGDRCDPCDDVDVDGACDEAPILVQGSGSGEEIIIEWLSPTRFIGNTSDPGYGLNWTSPLFSDSSWTLGQYGAGYENNTGGAEDLLLADVNSGSRSVYTRSQFIINDVSEVENLWLGADYDDGYAVWINGVEVFRSAEMPGGLLEWGTDAIALHESSNGSVPEYGELNDISTQGIPTLKNGLNTLAVAAWNYAGPSSDLVIVPRLSFNRPAAPTMRYLANFVNPSLSTVWTSQGFDDSVWFEGNFGVGYDVDSGAGSAQDLVNTIVPPISTSVYTRAKFSVVKDAVESLWIGADYDDGFVVWLNSFELYRSPEMPAGTLSWDSAPSPHESSNGEVPDFGTLIDVSNPGLIALKDGENLLAIGVWNSGAPETDALVVVPRLSINEEQIDNCVGVANADQLDTDLDGDGDACDLDDDDDGILDDGDISGNGSDAPCTGGATTGCDDNCPLVVNPLQEDLDLDGIGDACDACPSDQQNDADTDGVCGDVDNCPAMFNPDQRDNEPDGAGDACDPDDDNDGILDDGSASGTIGDARCTAGATASCDDNCQFVANADQADGDADGYGSACDCAAADGGTWGPPGDASQLTVDGTTLSWQAPAASGANTVRYDTLRSADPADFVTPGVCVETDGVDTVSTDAAVPASNVVHYYLIRVENDCPSANSAMGRGTDDVPRIGAACP